MDNAQLRSNCSVFYLLLCCSVRVKRFSEPGTSARRPPYPCPRTGSPAGWRGRARPVQWAACVHLLHGVQAPWQQNCFLMHLFFSFFFKSRPLQYLSTSQALIICFLLTVKSRTAIYLGMTTTWISRQWARWYADRSFLWFQKQWGLSIFPINIYVKYP